jgi:hypothetical protein
LVVHVNFDADAETWLPLVPKGLQWIPNAGGLPEIIRAVNKYEWAEFTLPSIYLKTHEPVGEVIVRQDMADGGWDGNYSWAEKYPSHVIWTELEKSRLYTRRAEALLSLAPGPELKSKARAMLYEGRDSSFFHRLRGLSTTHFGMSTPLVNEERQAVAEAVVSAARDRAETAERLAADAIAAKDQDHANDVLYAFLIPGASEASRDSSLQASFQLLRLPVILDSPLPQTLLEDDQGHGLDHALVNLEPFSNGRVYCELMVPLIFKPGGTRRLFLKKAPCQDQAGEHSGTGDAPDRLENDRLVLVLDRAAGVASLTLDAREFAGPGFLRHFITYQTGKKPATFFAEEYEFLALAGEQGQGVKRSRLRTHIPFPTRHGKVEATVDITFTLPGLAPWLIADVRVKYPRTVKEDLLVNVQQHLRRYLDLDWIEVAPFELHPLLSGTRVFPLKVWKHNYLGVTSWFELNYGQINPKNAELDSFNHHVTAGWVAVTDRERGLLLAESADRLSSYAFCPMRLTEREGAQQLWLNPFGSYYGKQMDYSHLGGNGLGGEIAETASSALRPNGPSYNGMTETFSLMLAPYAGDSPPPELQAAAAAFFYPPAVVYLKSPDGLEARLRQDVERLAAGYRREDARRKEGPLPAPLAFLANPTEGAVDLVWDEPEDARIEGYEVEWRENEEGDWHSVQTSLGRRHRVSDLSNGREYIFRLRSLGCGQASDWSEELMVQVGPVKTAGILSNAGNVSFKTVMKTLHYINVHLLTTP